MERTFAMRIEKEIDRLSGFASGLSRRTVLAATVASFAAVAWLIDAASPFIAFPVVVSIAAGWCLWLERHPNESGNFR